MSNIEEVFEILKDVTSVSGSIAKIDILKDNYDNELLKKVLDFVFNPFIVTGLSDKKLSKDIAITESSMDFVECMDYLRRHNTGRDEDIKIAKSVIEKYENYKDLCHKIITQNFHDLGIAATTINKVWKNLIPKFDVQLAEKYYENTDFVVDKEFTITEKMDGFRCVAIKHENDVNIYARSGKVINGLIEIEDELRSWTETDFALDCEILIKNRNRYPSKTQYKLTSKIVSSKDEIKRGVCLNAFDIIDYDEWVSQKCTKPYSERRKSLERFRGRGDSIIITDVLYSGSDTSMIEKLHNEAKSKNQEGIMININDAMYEFKRTKVLLKCKTFFDCDAYIDDIIEGTGKNVGKVGAFKCHFSPSPSETINFECGSGFTDEERVNYWNDKTAIIGRLCECKYFEITVNKDGEKSIRFPVFKTLKPLGSEPHNYDSPDNQKILQDLNNVGFSELY